MAVDDFAALADQVLSELKAPCTLRWHPVCAALRRFGHVVHPSAIAIKVSNTYTTQSCNHCSIFRSASPLRQDLLWYKNHWYVHRTMVTRAALADEKRRASHLSLSSCCQIETHVKEFKRLNTIGFKAKKKKVLWPERHRQWAQDHGVTWIQLAVSTDRSTLQSDLTARLPHSNSGEEEDCQGGFHQGLSSHEEPDHIPKGVGGRGESGDSN